MLNIKQHFLSLPQKAQEFFIREENKWIYEMISKNFPGPEPLNKIAGIYYATMVTVTFGVPYLIGKKLVTNMIKNFKEGFSETQIKEKLQKDLTEEQKKLTNIQALPDPTISKQYNQTEAQKINQKVDTNNNTVNQYQGQQIGK